MLSGSDPDSISKKELIPDPRLNKRSEPDQVRTSRFKITLKSNFSSAIFFTPTLYQMINMSIILTFIMKKKFILNFR